MKKSLLLSSLYNKSKFGFMENTPSDDFINIKPHLLDNQESDDDSLNLEPPVFF